MNRELIERLIKVAEQACKCLALEVILQGNDEPNIQEWESTVAETRAALAAPVVTPDAWLAEAERLYADMPTYGYNHKKEDRFLAHLRARPAVPDGYKLLKDTTGQDRD